METKENWKWLWQWECKGVVCKCAAKNLLVSGALVQEHAQEVAKTVGKSEFRASNGWLESFR